MRGASKAPLSVAHTGLQVFVTEVHHLLVQRANVQFCSGAILRSTFSVARCSRGPREEVKHCSH
uniref:Uncharacterized protein n=1 Tax=Anguilla anguilla TaxID=7936 RepID=A0A0E9X440_ANGAN